MWHSVASKQVQQKPALFLQEARGLLEEKFSARKSLY